MKEITCCSPHCLTLFSHMAKLYLVQFQAKMAKFCSPFLDQNGSKTSQGMLSAKLNLNFSFLSKSLVRSSLEYADVVWDGCSESESNLLESLQIEGAKVETGALKGTNRVSTF